MAKSKPQDKPIAIFTADCHLAPGAWTSRPTLAGDSYRTFHWLVSQAIEMQVPLIIGGDLIDTKRPDPQTISVMRKEFSRMEKANVECLYILGNHDKTDPPWMEAVHAWPRNVNFEHFEIHGLPFYAFDWQSSADLLDAQMAVPTDTQILVTHQGWREFLPEHIAGEGNLADTPAVDLILAGDFHKTLEMELIGRDGQSVVAISPGSTCMQSIDEDTRKVCVVLHAGPRIDGKSPENYSWEYRPIPQRPTCISVPLIDESAVDEFFETLGEFLERCEEEYPEEWIQDPYRYNTQPIVRVVYSEDDRFNTYARAAKICKNRAHLFFKSLPVGKALRSRTDGQRAKTMQQAILERVEDQDVRKLCLQLCEEGLEPAQALEEAERQFYEESN